ncbi:MAG: 4Fe-4S ferredoxin [Candidatus Latescibacterota bacterium]|nr:MAG: 4Fe-4S ferredoxin [Candidatus Latescibacterota bacterium]
MSNKIFKGRRLVQLSALFLFVSALAFGTSWGGRVLRSVLSSDPLWLFGGFVGLWGTVLLGSGFLLGRAFCGWICPLGTLLEVLPSGRRSVPKGWEKSGILALTFVTVAVLVGPSLPLAFSPLTLLARSLILLLFPPISFLADELLSFTSPLWEKLGLGRLAYLSVQVFHFRGTGSILAVLAGILCLNTVAPRFWCRHLCPLGAFLGLASRLGLLRRKVGSSCTSCGLCASACPMGAIPKDDPTLTRRERCMLCGRCVSVCPQRAVGFSFKGGRASDFLPSRRAFLTSIGLGTFVGLLVRGTASKLVPPSDLIRPPNSLPEGEFLERCVRCGACMRVCPTGGLQPALLEGGAEALWTPRLVPRIGPCEPECTLCGEVCPTGAIRPFFPDEKRSLKLGTAVVYKDRCLAWGWGKACLVCDEACPYDAVKLVPVPGKVVKGPVVDYERCTGCGVCEHECPVPGQAAIRVERVA